MGKQLTCLLVMVLALVFVWADDGAVNGTSGVPPTISTLINSTVEITTTVPKNLQETTLPPTPSPTTSNTTVKPDTTTSTTPSTTTTSTTPATTTTPQTTTTTIATTTTPTTPAAPTSTANPAASTTPAPSKDGSWGWGPFFAGIAFAAGLSSVGYVLWRFYKVRTERNYHTL